MVETNSKQSLLNNYKRNNLKFLVRAEKDYQDDQIEDMEVTKEADVGKEVTSVSFLICAKFFADLRPRFQVKSASLTVLLSTELSAATTDLTFPWSE